jgi:hypothetical protein
MAPGEIELTASGACDGGVEDSARRLKIYVAESLDR